MLGSEREPSWVPSDDAPPVPVAAFSYALRFSRRNARGASDVLDGWSETLSRIQLFFRAGQEGVVGAHLMAATGSFLFGVVLLIFAYSIAFGFVFDLAEPDRLRLPPWMRVQGIAELKHTLVQVIIVYLIVDFATDVSEPETRLSWDTLVLPSSILLLAGALALMSRSGLPGESVNR